MMHPDAVREMLESRDSELAELREQLAAANTLLRQWEERSHSYDEGHSELAIDTRAHLSAQPAAPGYCPFSGPGKACACGEPGCPARQPAAPEEKDAYDRPGYPSRLPAGVSAQ